MRDNPYQCGIGRLAGYVCTRAVGHDGPCRNGNMPLVAPAESDRDIIKEKLKHVLDCVAVEEYTRVSRAKAIRRTVEEVIVILEKNNV